MAYQIEMMRTAVALAVENVRRGEGGPFAAIVVKEGRILSRGTNRVTTANDPTAHAEVVAIREACRTLGSFQLEGCEIYTTCEPCPMCLGAIYWARADRVYFACTQADAAAAGFDDSFIYQEISIPPDQRRIPMIQHQRTEGLGVFEAWEKKEGKVRY
ncbi:MAG: nucleoside deaminase [Bacteroidetes bacterium]|nr:nucleoside deaminase [Bacteroidota bacterium]